MPPTPFDQALPDSYHRPPDAVGRRVTPVPAGPRAYRARIRARGPFVALALPTVMGAAALMSLRDNATTLRGFGGFLLAVLAAPGLLVVGAPLQSGSTRYLAACAGSALLWFAVGVVASRRSTRRPAASWREFWVEYAWLVGAVWCGVVAALVLSNLVLGRALL